MPAGSRSTRSGSVRARSRKKRPARPGGCCASNGSIFRGTPVRFWLDSELAEIFGVDATVRSERRRDLRPDGRAGRTGVYRPRALLEKFHITVLATTDDPCPIWRHTPRSPPSRRGGTGDPHLPPRSLSRACPAGMARRGGAARRGRETDVGDYAGTWTRSRNVDGTSSRTARRQPTTATPTSGPSRSGPPRRTHLRAGPQGRATP